MSACSMRLSTFSKLCRYSKLIYISRNAMTPSCQLWMRSATKFNGILGIKCFCSSNDGKTKLELAKPGKPPSAGLSIEASSDDDTSSSSDSDSGSSSDSDSSSDDEELSPQLKQAAKEASDALPGDTSQNESELLRRLRAHATLTQSQKEGELPKTTTPISDIFSGMKVEQSRRLPRRPGSIEDTMARISNRDGDKNSKPDFKRQKYDKTRPRQQRADIRLYEGPAIGVFQEADTNTRKAEVAGESLFDVIEREEIWKQLSVPPNNAFEETILLTKQGKLWKFPIDNEQGMENEKNVGFNEHVFLDHLLKDFPSKGPVRHFMELVITGLSSNPYITVEQKYEHVNWFKDYFKDKYKIIDALIAPKDSEKTQDV